MKPLASAVASDILHQNSVSIYIVIVHIGTYTVGIKNESTACNCMYILNPYNLYS